MTVISHNKKAMSKIKASHYTAPIIGYLKGCHRQGQDWVFDQAAQFSYGVLLLLAGLITEAINWF